MTAPQPRRRRSGREWTVLFIMLLVGAVAGAAIWAAFGPVIAAAEAAEPVIQGAACADSPAASGNAGRSR